VGVGGAPPPGGEGHLGVSIRVARGGVFAGTPFKARLFASVCGWWPWPWPLTGSGPLAPA
jgi:hypothetical protein